MIVRRFEDILPSPRAVHADTWSSFRLLTRDDGMGFSLHETWIHPGTQTHIWYKHHLEAVYCIEGEGEIEPVGADGRGTGEPITIKPGVMYALDAHDRHFLRARTRLRLICVFNPPLRGDEKHGPDGAYAAPVSADGSGIWPGVLTTQTPPAATPATAPPTGSPPAPDHVNGTGPAEDTPAGTPVDDKEETR